jgi:hypothetical protein
VSNTFFDELEEIAISALGGVAGTAVPLSQADASHPAILAAATVATDAGGMLAKVFPEAGLLAGFLLPIVQAFGASASPAAPIATGGVSTIGSVATVSSGASGGM